MGLQEFTAFFDRSEPACPARLLRAGRLRAVKRIPSDAIYSPARRGAACRKSSGTIVIFATTSPPRRSILFVCMYRSASARFRLVATTRAFAIRNAA